MRTVVAIVVLLMPTSLYAQRDHCAPRPSIGAGLGMLTLDFEMDPEIAGVGRHGLASTTGTGREMTINGSIPVSGAWSLAAEAGIGRMAVETQQDASGAYVIRRTGDDVVVSRVQVGLQRQRHGTVLCSYSGAALGLYRYSFRGVAVNVGGASGNFGVEVRDIGRGAVFIDLSLSVAISEYKAPTAASLVVNIRPTIGWRYQF